MTIDKLNKKKIIEDWRKAFPQLKPYSQNKLYGIIDSVILGLELTKLPRTEEYRPHFVIYSLWENNIKKCLDTPILVQEYHNKKGLQYSISNKEHCAIFEELVKVVKKQSPLPLNEKFDYQKLSIILDNHSTKKPLSASKNSYLQAKLISAKFNIVLYSNQGEAHSVLKEINKRNWDSNNFRMWNTDLEQWLSEFNEKIKNRNQLLEIIDKNKKALNCKIKDIIDNRI